MSNVKIAKYRNIVYAIWTLNGQKIKFSTGLKIIDNDWDGEKVKRSNGRYKIYNKIIEEKTDWLYSIILELRRQGKEPSPQNIRALVNAKKPITKKPLDSKTQFISDEYKAYIELKSSQVSKRSIRNIKYTLVVLNEFEQGIDSRLELENFDKFLFERFLNFLIKTKRYKDATIDKHLRVFKTFLRWRYPDHDFTFIKYNSKISSEHNIITINWEEYLHIRDSELTGSMAKTRDLFIFLCTTGMRFSDSQRFLPQWIKSGTIEFRQLKTSGIAVVPLLDDCNQVLKNNDGKPPKISAQKFNDYLKKLFTQLEIFREVNFYEFRNGRVFEKVARLCDVITSHIARKSFITIMLEKGVPVQDVMKMSGHSDFRAMRPYIAISKKHLKEVSKLW